MRKTRRLSSSNYASSALAVQLCIFCISSQKNMNNLHETFLSTFFEIYETNLPYKQVTVKREDVKNPWMSKALKK